MSGILHVYSRHLQAPLQITEVSAWTNGQNAGNSYPMQQQPVPSRRDIDHRNYHASRMVDQTDGIAWHSNLQNQTRLVWMLISYVYIYKSPASPQWKTSDNETRCSSPLSCTRTYEA